MKENFHVEKILSLQGLFFKSSCIHVEDMRKDMELNQSYWQILGSFWVSQGRWTSSKKTSATPVVKEKLWVSV